ncbi:ankyrin repeat domain-containing protein [Ralstonia pseudosolanacearum]
MKRTVSEIEAEMEYHQEDGNLGKVMDLVDEIGNMQDRLYTAIAKGDLEGVLYFESLGFALDEPHYLKVASQSNQCEVIELLVHKGIDIHANEEEALCVAAEQGSIDAVRCLVGLGANVHTQDERPVKLATHADRISVVQYLVGAGASIDAVLEITGSGSFYPEMHKWAQSYKSKLTLEAQLPQRDESAPKTKI